HSPGASEKLSTGWLGSAVAVTIASGVGGGGGGAVRQATRASRASPTSPRLTLGVNLGANLITTMRLGVTVLHLGARASPGSTGCRPRRPPRSGWLPRSGGGRR